MGQAEACAVGLRQRGLVGSQKCMASSMFRNVPEVPETQQKTEQQNASRDKA